MTLKNFIEVTDVDGAKVLVPVNKILGIVFDKDGSLFIEMATENGTVSSGVFVIESYDEIKNKLKQCEG